MSRVAIPFIASAVPVLLLAAPDLWAAPADGPPPPLSQAWTLSAWTLLPLAVLAAAYATGWMRQRAHGGTPLREVLAFAFAMLALALALVWPLDAYAGYLASAHVAQHMVLLALAPPLLLAARSPVVVNPKLSRVAFFQQVLPPGTPILNWGCVERGGDKVG